MRLAVVHVAPNEPNQDEWGFRWRLTVDGDQYLESGWHVDAGTCRDAAVLVRHHVWPALQPLLK